MAVQEKFDLVVRAKDEASSVLRSISGNMVGVATAAAGLVAVGSFLKSSLAAAQESEVAWNKLGNAVQKHGGIWSVVRGQFERFATSLQNQTGISDEAIAESLQLFVDYGASGEQAMQRVRVAADLAAGTGMDLASATNILAKASSGATEMLGRYGIRVDENLPKAEKFAAALELIADRFGGRAVQNAETLAGRIQILSERYGELKENVGGLLVGPMTDLVNNLNDQIVVLQSNVSWWDKIFSGAEKYAEMANRIRLEELGMMSAHASTGMPKPTVLGLTPEQIAQAAKDQKLLNDAKRESLNIELQAANFRGTGFDTSLRGPGYFGMPDDGTAEREADAATKRLFAVDQASEDMLSNAQRNFDEFASMVHGSMTNAANQLVGVMFGVKTSFAEIFKGMAQDWIQFFISEILKQTALRLAGSLFGALFPASSAILAPVGGPIPTGALGKAGVGGLDIASAGAGRFASGGLARPASVSVTIQGDVIGEQEYVTRKIIPAIETAIAYGQSKIAVR